MYAAVFSWGFGGLVVRRTGRMGQTTSKTKHTSQQMPGRSERKHKPKANVFGSSGTSKETTTSRDHHQDTRTSSSVVGSKGDNIDKFFQKYKDAREDSILAEGMEKFCEDLGVDPTEFVVLLIAWKFEARQMCTFTRSEFIKGCQKLKVHDVKSLKLAFPGLIQEVQSPQRFQDLYLFTFSFGLDHASGQRVLPMDMAVPLWELVFSQQPPDILARWCNFLKATGVKGISRDTWQLFLPFCRTISSDLSNYDEAEAWPSLFDDFVDFERNGQEN